MLDLVSEVSVRVVERTLQNVAISLRLFFDRLLHVKCVSLTHCENNNGVRAIVVRLRCPRLAYCHASVFVLLLTFAKDKYLTFSNSAAMYARLQG